MMPVLHKFQTFRRSGHRLHFTRVHYFGEPQLIGSDALSSPIPPTNKASISPWTSGVDVLAHVALMGGPWPTALVERMRAAHITLIPTLTLFDVEAKKAQVSPEEDERWIDLAVHQLKVYADAGGLILFGTDVGYTDHFDTAEEYTLMARAGMTFPQILASLTTNPAERFGASGHTGRIANHMDADVTVLDGDPATNISAFSKVRYTIRDGRIIYSDHPTVAKLSNHPATQMK
jgi:imidazolonepropionase-like amidohydrolase